MTLFEKIAAKEIPAEFVHEDDQCIAFQDINAQAPLHILVVPRKPIPRIAEANDSDAVLLGHLLSIAGKIGNASSPNGFRVIINNGKDGGESIPHLHLHVLGGRPLNWPPG